MSYSLVILDLDGTLAHTAPDLILTLNRVIEHYDINSVEISDIGHLVGHGAKAMIRKAFDLQEKPLSDEMHEEIFVKFLADYEANLADQTFLFEGALDAMDRLTAAGFEFAVCTNKMVRMAEPLLEQLGVKSRFKSITGGDSFKFRKPDPRHLQETAILGGHAIENCIMVGDTITDISAADRAEIPSIAVSFGYSEVPVETLGATATIDHFSQLPKTIMSMCE